MTQNQIAYAKFKEEQTHNRITEAETARSNAAQEALKRREQDITKQHYNRSDSENVRSHRASESLTNAQNILRGQELDQKYAQLGETRRSNLANEGIARTRANADAYLSYSTAGLRQAEQAKTDLDAALTAANISYTHAKERSEYANYYNTLANVSYTNARTENVIMQTNMKPIETWSNAVGNVGKAISGASSLGGTETSTQTTYYE